MNGKTRQATGVFGFVLAMALGVMLALGSASNTAFAEQEGTGLGESLEDSGIVLSMADDTDALTVDSELEDGLELVRSDEGEAITVEPQSDEVALEAQAAAAHVSYRTHVQSYGWQGLVRDGEVAGTSGRAKRLEGIELKLTGAPYAGGITYRTHVQGIGWQGWKSNGQTSGTSGQARRLEAIEIKLTGTMAQKYDVWYRVHAQTYGWMGWARNGNPAGTEGYAKRLEAIEVVLTPKGAAAPGSTANAYNKYVGKPYKVKYDLTHLKNGGTYVFEGGDGYIGGGIYVPGTIAEYRTYFGSRGSINVPSKFYAGIGKEWLSHGIIPGTGLQIEYIGTKDERKAEAISIKGRLGDIIEGLPNKSLTLRELASGLRSLGGEIDVVGKLPASSLRSPDISKCGLCYVYEKGGEIHYADKSSRPLNLLHVDCGSGGKVSSNSSAYISVYNLIYM